MQKVILSAQEGYFGLAMAEWKSTGGRLVARLDGETGLGETGLCFGDILQAFPRPPVFLRHMAPAGQELPISGWQELLRLAPALYKPYAPAPFSVQTRIIGTASLTPFTVNQPLSAILGNIGPLNVREPQAVLSVTVCDRVYFGMSRTAENLNPFAGGRIRLAPLPGQVSRAESKLEEAKKLFPPFFAPGMRVLDLGAAPGGWSRLAAAWGGEVTAVDPAALDESLQGYSIRHYKMRSQEFLRLPHQPFQLLLNDMRMDPEASAGITCDCAVLLSPGAHVLMTLKLSGDAKKEMDAGVRALERKYSILAVRQLFHNRSEVTVLAKKEE